MNKLLLGSKYYRYDDNNNIEVIRIYRFNDTEIKAYLDDDKDVKFKISLEELQSKYVKLNPHGIMNFCIVQIKDGLNDVIVTLHKMSDLTTNEPTPYCVCRQNITDVFANQLKISDKMYVGCSMSLDTCPPDIDYRIMIACNGIEKSVNLCVYMDDTLDDILGMIKTKDFDRTLESLFIDHINYETSHNNKLAPLKDLLLKQNYHIGYCKSLRLLLEQNNFMYDFYQAFNIIPIDEDVKYDAETGEVDDRISDIISDIYEVNIVSTLCMRYWYDIDLTNIDNDYVLIMDKNNNLYVVAYVSIGPKHIDIEKVESEENIERMANSTIGNNKSVREAYNHIRLYKDKYK